MSTQLTPFGSSLRTPYPPVSPAAGRLARRDLERVTVRAVVAQQMEQARAALALTVLEEAAGLSALESLLVTAVPLGESRYRAIVDAFVVGSSAAIIRLQP